MKELLDSGAALNNKLYKYYYAKNFGNKIVPYPVQQYDESDNVINQFKTISAAATSLGYNRNAISKCIVTGSIDKFGYK